MSPSIVTHFKNWYGKFERPISSLSLIGGFVFDAVTLTRVDEFWENFWVGAHLLIVATCIVLINIEENDGESESGIGRGLHPRRAEESPLPGRRTTPDDHLERHQRFRSRFRCHLHGEFHQWNSLNDDEFHQPHVVGVLPGRACGWEWDSYR